MRPEMFALAVVVQWRKSLFGEKRDSIAALEAALDDHITGPETGHGPTVLTGVRGYISVRRSIPRYAHFSPAGAQDGHFFEEDAHFYHYFQIPVNHIANGSLGPRRCDECHAFARTGCENCHS